jgi:hypothetical protein
MTQAAYESRQGRQARRPRPGRVGPTGSLRGGGGTRWAPSTCDIARLAADSWPAAGDGGSPGAGMSRCVAPVVMAAPQPRCGQPARREEVRSSLLRISFRRCAGPVVTISVQLWLAGLSTVL